MSLVNSPLAFSASDGFTLTVEEELLMVTPATLQPRRGTDAVLAAVKAEVGSIHETTSDGVLELVTPACRTVGEATAILAQLRAGVGAVTPLIGAGVHPLGRFGDVLLRSGAHHGLITETVGALMHQTPRCAVRVHVGMPDGETAVRASNGMRQWIPLLRALGANSPYWYGRESGLASTRSVLCNSFPRAGIPRAFKDYADFAASVQELRALGECPDFSFLWWDVRPNPLRGTLEVCALDAQSSLGDLSPLLALIHCLAVHESNADAHRGPSAEVLRELDFRASRDGLDARLMLDGDVRSVREIAYRTIALAGAYAVDVSCWDELMKLHKLLEDGNGAQRQRRHEQEGGLRLLLRRLADETLPPRSAAMGAMQETATVTALPMSPARIPARIQASASDGHAVEG